VLEHKSRLESGPVTTDMITTVVHSYKSLMNDVTHYKLVAYGAIVCDAI